MWNLDKHHAPLKWRLSMGLLFMHSLLFAQLLQVTPSNTPPYTPTNLISNVFLGNGVEVTSITYGGNPVSVGYFTGGGAVIGIERGIVMTTGLAESSGLDYGANGIGNQWASKDIISSGSAPELLALTSGLLNDVAVYTIRFIPTSDTLRFRYCFASEEYPEYGCSDYNDVFGFFIQGPGYPTFTNIARIPNTNLPVTINNLHPQNPDNPACFPLNAQYFNNNFPSTKQPVYDGFTDVFTAEAIVVPCQEYTIKLAIADVTDGIYDSGVFLEAKSFGTGSLRAEIVTASGDGTITEGCAVGTLKFMLPAPAVDTIDLDYSVFGTATNGVDYQPIPLDLVILPGQTGVQIPLVALKDVLNEGNETLFVDIQRDPCNRDTIQITIRENTLVAPQLQTDTTLCKNIAQPITLTGQAPVPVQPPSVFSSNASYNLNFLFNGPLSPVLSPITVSGVTPLAVGPGMIERVCIDISHPFLDDIDAYLISPSGAFLELTTDNGANGDNYTNTCFVPTASQKINFPGPQAPATAAPFTGDFLPEGDWADLYGSPSNGTWRLQVADDAMGFNGTLNRWSIVFAPSYRVEYAWTPTVGLSCNTCPQPAALPDTTTRYIVTATDNYGCQAKDTITFTMLEGIYAPTIECDSVSPNSITFAWNQVPNTTGYQISVNNGPWITPNLLDTSHIVTNLSPLTSVEVRVRGIGTQPCPPAVATGVCTNCAAPVLTYTKQDVRCFGGATGRISIQTDQANPPYTYRILGSQSSTDSVFTGLAAGTYQIRATDRNGCFADVTVQITQPPQVQATVVQSLPISCFGQSDGSLQAVVQGGTGNMSYLWSNGGISQSISNLAVGTYTVTVTDQNQCRDTTTFTLTQPSSIAGSAVTVPARCFGTATGSATLNTSGGTAPYTHTWSNGQTGANLNNLLAGNYQVTTTDARGCTITRSVAITQPTAIQPTTVSQAARCYQSSDGSLQLSVTGGVPAYSYLWSNGATQANLSAIPSGSYTVTITDANLCTVTATDQVNSPNQLVISLQTTDARCHQTATGSISASVTGGIQNYKYSWSGIGQQTATATQLTAGIYTLTVTDANNCTQTATAQVGQPPTLVSTLNSTPVRCFGQTNGSIASQTVGGTPPYNYSWSNGLTTGQIQNLPAGIYTVTITDSQSCTASVSVVVQMPDSISVTTVQTNLLCFNDASGKLNATATGGTGALTYTWTSGTQTLGNAPLIENLPAGTYLLRVQDINQCQAFRAYQVTEPAQLVSLTPAVADTICFGANNGTAYLRASGGTLPYNYFLQGSPLSNNTAQQLTAGGYQWEIIDANGCRLTDQFVIYQKGQLNAWTQATAPLCYNGSSGTATVSSLFYGSQVADPTQFSYRWSANGQTQITAQNLAANGTYTVTITDSDGCSTTATATIPNAPVYSSEIVSRKEPTCFGYQDGTITVSQTGGKSPYTYLWSPAAGSQTTPTAQQLGAGNYQVTITDALGCTLIQQVTLTQPPQVTLSLATQPVKCFGEQNGKAISTAQGGTGNLTYSWSNFANTPTITDLGIGTYTCTVTDAQGCTSVSNAVVGGPAEQISARIDTRDPVCYGGDEGQVIFDQVQGGTPPYQYCIDNRPFNGSKVQLGLIAGVYTPYIRDANGCIVQFPPVQIQQRGQMTVDLGPDFTIILGQDTSLEALVRNALGNVTFVWSAEDSLWLSCMDCPNPQVKGLQYQNTFELYIVDSLGCFAEDFIIIQVLKPRRVFVPTAFTPNGDMNNDILTVHGQDGVKLLEFNVYDRWGEPVYTQKAGLINDDTFGWDGNFRGKPMDPDVFVWTLLVRYTDGVEELLKGSTTLIR